MEEVMIVGAGIAGVATAVALRKVGIRALVLERSKELRVTGAALSLQPNAWLALDALGVSGKLAPLYDPIPTGYVTDVQTKSIQEVHFAANNRNGALTRSVHRKVLLEVLADELPPIRGLSVFPEGHGLDDGHKFQQFVDVGKRGDFVTLNDKELYWFFLGKSPAKGLPTCVPRCGQALRSFELDMGPLMFRYPWDVLFGNLAKSNVTVAGDALHPMTPDLGQGGCSALEDAVVLGQHLGDLICKHCKLMTQDIGFAIERYAKERRLRATMLITASYFSGYMQQDGSSGMMKLLRDVVFYRLLLSRVVNRISRYDCGKLPSVSSLPSWGSKSST
ncbi:monooxygenase 3-like [Eucalyptus grandis]|uniref:monooxygenase 3-like n=1 Tax=Eucalyptus grandis TaxID=71139 RepID=UPI00192ECEC0|nr:monooxygenase 3-like [Eucalyptus grandis]